MADVLPVAFQGNVFARQIGHFVKVSFQRRVENALHERRLSRSADTRYDGEDVQGEPDVDATEVVHSAPLQFDSHVPWAA